MGPRADGSLVIVSVKRKARPYSGHFYSAAAVFGGGMGGDGKGTVRGIGAEEEAEM
jgi:hypothetical protein